MAEKIYIPKDKNLLDPKVDSTFKTLFTKQGEKSKNALKKLIGAIINHEPKEIQVLNTELPQDIKDAKDIRLDIRCQMSDGEIINIEMQTCMGSDNLKKRSIYYACRMMSSIPMKGEKYDQIPKIFHVMFTDFQIFKSNKKYLQTFTIKNDEEELVDNLQFIFIQMPLLDIGNKEIDTLPDLEKWVIFLKEGNDINKRDLLNKLMGSNDGIREAGEILMEISEDLKEWVRQEMRYKAQMDYQSGMISSYDKGKEEGKIEDARGMKAENIPIETIAKITGLASEQISSL